MSALTDRNPGQCELCAATDNLAPFTVSGGPADAEILLCGTCHSQLTSPATINADHFQCLRDSMWSPVLAVQVQAWRLLSHLKSESWAGDLLDMLYLEPEQQAWAEAGAIASAEVDDSTPTKDCHGSVLAVGDTVTVIKDLPVKGSSMVIKRGTHVRGINLTSNPEHIEGRVDGQQVVIISAYCKKV